jgi:hypothetical protein
VTAGVRSANAPHTLRCTVNDLRHRIEHEDLLFDEAIERHGFSPFNRDYDVIVALTGRGPDGVPAGRRHFRFTHCVPAETRTALSPDAWREP